MLAELAAAHAEVAATFEEASQGAGHDLWSLSAQGPEDQLNRTENTQPALLAASVAVWRVWQKLGGAQPAPLSGHRSEEHTSELQSLMRISYAVFCLKKKKNKYTKTYL